MGFIYLPLAEIQCTLKKVGYGTSDCQNFVQMELRTHGKTMIHYNVIKSVI